MPVWLPLVELEQVGILLVLFGGVGVGACVLVVGELPVWRLCVTLLLGVEWLVVRLASEAENELCEVRANTPMPDAMTRTAMTAMIHFGKVFFLPLCALEAPCPLCCCRETACSVCF